MLKPPEKKSGASGNRALAAASTMSGALLGMGLLGSWLDKKFDTTPYLLLAGLALGLTVGFYDLWKAMFPEKREK